MACDRKKEILKSDIFVAHTKAHNMSKNRMLVVGASGQIGTELVLSLRAQYGADNVVAADIREASEEVMQGGPFEQLDILNKEELYDLVKKHEVAEIFQLAALLSASAEKTPMFAWQLNMDGLFNVLELVKEGVAKKLFWPSSIAVFGPTTPKLETGQHTVTDPDTVYGISKLAGERWCEYYHKKYNVDVRSVRYPGLISYKSLPGGGTTDYAVDIFHSAVKQEPYECFLSENTALPMMYMPDALKATMNLMAAPADQVDIRSAYNIASMSFDPKTIAAAIKKHYPSFEINYKPDFRQQIADSWPASIDDSVARKDWGWSPDFALEQMVSDMLHNLNAQPALVQGANE